MKRLTKIPLQFFGESAEETVDKSPEDLDDFDDDFDDYLTDVPEYYGSDNADDEPDDTPDDEPDEKNAEAEAADEELDEDEKTAEDAKNDDVGASQEPPASTESQSELISELRALGYQGEDISSLVADMKRKREGKQTREASAERRAVNSASKSHLKTSAPGQSAGGDGTGGITERQVEDFSSRTGCSKDEARRLLAKHSKMME